MTYEELARQQQCAEINLMRDIRVLLAAANHVLKDDSSSLHPLAKFTLETALSRINESFYGEQK